MSEQANGGLHKIDDRSGQRLKTNATTDAIGLWFAAVMVAAFLAAGVIVYRAANQDTQTASNDLPTAVHPINPPPTMWPR